MKTIQSISLLWLLALAGLSHLAGQENAAQRHEMATNQLKQLAVEQSARCLDDVRDLEGWKQQRTKLREELLDMLGLIPLPKRTPLRAEVTGVLDRPAFRIEKLVFQSSPGLHVTGNLYLPRGASGRLPTVLYLCGHSPHPLGAKFHYQDRAIWFASHGFACLVLDTLEFAEVAGIHHGTHDLNLWHWLSLGYTPAGVEVWNAIRALDYLETRPEVDASRIGLTGISGGGAMTWYTAAVDERIAAAAPVCATFTWGSQASHWVARGQCDCIYYHNTFMWDFPVVAALIAPRPLLILSGRRDSIFPPDGYHEVFQRAKRIYDLHSRAAAGPDRIREVDDDVEHSDPPLFLREARQWMTQWLKNDSSPLPLETNSPPKETAEDLACLTRIPSDTINFRVHNQFVATAPVKKPSSRSEWGKRRAEVRSQLHERVFRWFPTNPVPFETAKLGSSGGWHVRYGYADYIDCSFQTEAGVRVRAQLHTPKQAPAGAPLLIYVKRAVDSFYGSDVDELLPLMNRCPVLILNPRLTEQSMNPADRTDVERSAVWVGRTVASMQVWDILRTVEWAISERQLPSSRIVVYGKGEMGIAALYAAFFDEHISQVILNDPPGSHWQGPALLNVLRVTDIAELAGAIAPRRISSLTQLPTSFELTKAIYRLERASDQFDVAGSLPEAMEISRFGDLSVPRSSARRSRR